MVFVESLKLDLPDAFPGEQYGALMASARRILLANKDDAWTEFAGASNLIGWRFRAAWDYFDAYSISWRKSGVHVSFEEIYFRERDLFGMFASGVSCVDSSCYAAWALASHKDVLGLSFGEDEKLRCTPRTLSAALGQATDARAERLLAALDTVMHAEEWSTWRELRNRMAHRSNLPRIIAGVFGGPPPTNKMQFAPTSSSPRVSAEPDALQPLLEWLSGSLSALLIGCCDLADAVSPQK